MPIRLPARIGRLTPATTLAWLLVTFLVLFPKGGFKFGGIPITWGYILLGLCGPPLFVARLLAFPLKTPLRLLGAALCILPFQAIFLYTAIVNGFEDPGFFASSVVNFYYLPALFLILFPWFYPRLDAPRLARHFCFCILAAALFGIAMFFYHPIVGSFIEIPFLTVNAGDYGEIELRKHIYRGTFLKLISTYNNGNLYGVATLILMPLYNVLEPKRWKRYTLVVALILTLSRTVWAGLILHELFSLAITLKSSIRRFPRVTPGPALRGLLAVAVMVGLVLLALTFNSNKLSFLFDENLGGRAVGLSLFLHPEWIPTRPIGPFYEIVYVSAVETFGVAGLLTVLLFFASPVVLYLAQPHRFRSPFQQAAFRGLILYAILCASDGAINLIPVLAFYWFAYMIFLFGWPGEEHVFSPQHFARLAPQSPPSASLPFPSTTLSTSSKMS